jgi:hypothetical protein
MMGMLILASGQCAMGYLPGGPGGPGEHEHRSAATQNVQQAARGMSLEQARTILERKQLDRDAAQREADRCAEDLKKAQEWQRRCDSKLHYRPTGHDRRQYEDACAQVVQMKKRFEEASTRVAIKAEEVNNVQDVVNYLKDARIAQLVSKVQNRKNAATECRKECGELRSLSPEEAKRHGCDRGGFWGFWW